MTLQPRTRLSSCHRHPTRPVTGFCALCLNERLASIDPDSRQEIPAPEGSGAAGKLRRCKSYSAREFPAAAGASEPPRRKSCDVRGRSRLGDLFNLDDRREGKGTERTSAVEFGNLGFELREEDENKDDRDGQEIRVSEPNVEENGAMEEGAEFKTMKEFIDLEWRSKKSGGRDFKDIAGSVWEAASVFSKKLKKWRQKQKRKKQNNDGGDNGGGLEDVDRRNERRPWRETQSEIGRRSCDTEPRISVEVGRYSFDEPRASWDGYLIGKAYPRVLAPMLSVDKRMSPGGSVQTKDYYSESMPTSTHRRRSFDRSNSHRKGGGAEFDEFKLASNANAKVSPESTDLFYGAKVLIAEEEEEEDSKETNSKRVENDGLELPKSVSRDSGVNKKGLKKLNKWQKVGSIFGLIQRRRGRKCGIEEENASGNVGDRQFSESWQMLSRAPNGEANGSVSQKLIRSYSVSCRRSSGNTAGLLNNINGAETKGNGLKRREDLMLQQNRSAGYSPSNVDNGLLRFYLTPLRSHRRSKSGKSKLRRSHSIAKTVL